MNDRETEEFFELLKHLRPWQLRRVAWHVRWLLLREQLEHLLHRGLVLLHRSRLALDLTYRLIDESQNGASEKGA